MQHFSITITSANINHHNLTLNELLNVLNEHFATVGCDYEPIIITDYEMGNVIEVFNGCDVTTFEEVFVEKFNKSYRICQLLEMVPYMNS